jgi:MoxR-like ATPase
MDITDKFNKACDYLQTSYFVSLSDNYQLGAKAFPAPIVFSMLAGLLNGKILTIGVPGSGKTTVEEAVGSICYNLPIKTVRASILHGSGDQTEEKMIGRPDLAYLHRGEKSEEKVVWSNFANIPGPKIIDEVNRLPPAKQNVLLDVIDRGNFCYLNEVLPQDEMSVFATSNYPDAGNTVLIDPLRDRFDMSIEFLPSAGHVGAARKCKPNKALLEEIANCKNLLYEKDDRQAFREAINTISEPAEFKLFLDYLTCETSYDPQTGIRRPGEPDTGNNHYQNLLNRRIKKSIGCGRGIANGTVDYMKAIAHLSGLSEVTVPIAVSVLERSLAHRLEFTPEALTQANKDRNDDPHKAPLSQYCARKELKKVAQRFYEHLPDLKALNTALYCKKDQEAIAIATKNLRIHPYFDKTHSEMTTKAYDPTRL